MKYYMAPMEGITGYVFRSVHHRHFPHVDKYYTPFLSPTQNRCFSPREIGEVLPEHNQGLCLVPQLLTRNAEDFIWAARELEQMGYSEVNFNLGCPSGTVVAKGKGSGFLSSPDELDRFFERVFQEVAIGISVKTRLGRYEPGEWEELMEIYNRYPLRELILHPRVQKDFYKNEPNRQAYREAAAACRHPLCYNGDLFDRECCLAFAKEYPDTQAVMLGRGLIANPGLVEWLTGGRELTREMLWQFHGEIYAGYQEQMPGNKAVLFKMKELWSYLICLFPDSKKQEKKIRKATGASEYEEAVEALFAEVPMDGALGYRQNRD